MTIARDDFERFRAHQRTVYRGVWFGLIAAAVAGCVPLVLAWSYLAGLVWAIALPLFGYDAIKRWNRRRWLRRFPDLAGSDFKWVPDPDGPKTGGR